MKQQQILRAQGAYYVASGLWPLFSMRSFERVTGPKADKWLVQMVGLLAATIGGSLLLGARREEIDDGIFTLAIGSALAFAGIDVLHAARRRISPIYLGDAFVELAIVAMLLTD
ncbi:MAG TPA: hypothetical protein VEW74_02685 [Candidatus Nitrosotalea sp.]|nr:hypothetical protein [Candidatus Nitrosotalea sp.]